MSYWQSATAVALCECKLEAVLDASSTAKAENGRR